ncbi:MAG: Eco57I restriction-modification methylase domain-containing protein, partial [Candidatus Thorarchaeota archaeon]
KALEEWSKVKVSGHIHVKQGNSLIGSLRGFEDKKDPFAVQKKNKFHWYYEFPEIFQESKNGFDIVIGNPPYGNIISDKEKQIIKKSYPYIVTGGRNGTWNIASLFIVRARMLLDIQGELGFLVPNSILRVGQFAKTRDFLLNQLTLWEIVDEANPFEQVTLEMVSLFCRVAKGTRKKDVTIHSRRSDVGQTNQVPISVLRGFSQHQEEETFL